MRPMSPPLVATSSPFCNSDSIFWCSFAFLDCGRMTSRYMTPKMSSMGISMPPSAPPGEPEPEDDDWANETRY